MCVHPGDPVPAVHAPFGNRGRTAGFERSRTRQEREGAPSCAKRKAASPLEMTGRKSAESEICALGLAGRLERGHRFRSPSPALFTARGEEKEAGGQDDCRSGGVTLSINFLSSPRPRGHVSPPLPSPQPASPLPDVGTSPLRVGGRLSLSPPPGPPPFTPWVGKGSGAGLPEGRGRDRGERANGCAAWSPWSPAANEQRAGGRGGRRRKASDVGRREAAGRGAQGVCAGARLGLRG